MQRLGLTTFQLIKRAEVRRSAKTDRVDEVAILGLALESAFMKELSQNSFKFADWLAVEIHNFWNSEIRKLRIPDIVDFRQQSHLFHDFESHKLKKTKKHFREKARGYIQN